MILDNLNILIVNLLIMNFAVQELLGASTNNNRSLIPFEVAAKNLWQYLQYGFVLMRVCEIGYMKKTLTKEFQADIINNDFRYLPIFGCCVKECVN